MNTIKECKDFYKTHYTLKFFINLFYKFITNILCIIYLFWFCFQIITTQNISEFLNENICNIAFIFYSFYKIHSTLIIKYNFIELFFEAVFLFCVFYDISNKNHLYDIQQYIISSIIISIIIFIFGTLYCIFKLDFEIYNNDFYYENAAEICCNTV